MKAIHRPILIKFILLCALLVGYFAYLSVEYDVATGGIASMLTWSFFVLCTPVADAGFLLDFPLRLLFNIRMIYSEIVIWIIAILINILSLHFAAEYYNTTPLTKIFKVIILTPFPYWSVIFLSMIGTFLSIKFGDEFMDVIAHKDRHFFHKYSHIFELIVMIVIFAIIIIVYYGLLSSLSIIVK